MHKLEGCLRNLQILPLHQLLNDVINVIEVESLVLHDMVHSCWHRMLQPLPSAAHERLATHVPAASC